MIPIFIEAAMRSLFVGLAVAAGLRIFRVRNVLAQKAAWGLVLISALAMPLLLPVTAQWNLLPRGVNVVLPAVPMTLLEELQARIQAKSGSESKFVPPITPIPQRDPSTINESPVAEQGSAKHAGELTCRTARTQQTARPQQDVDFNPARSASSSAPSIAYNADRNQETQLPVFVRRAIASPVILALILYCGIAALLLARLGLGLFAAIRLWRSATPVPSKHLPRDASALRVRASCKAGSPLTIGSAILLPPDYTTWDSEKFRIVIAHERSHIRQGDFYLQVLAGLYSALVWFSPLGWWLKHELAELSEAISDRAGIEEAASRTVYAQILLEFAAAPRRIPIGVAMARPGSLSRRIERLLNDSSFRQCFAGGRRALLSVVLVPLALFACTALVHVQAATDTQSPSLSQVAVSESTASPQLDARQAATSVEAVHLGEQMLPQLSTGDPTTQVILPDPAASASEPSIEMVMASSSAPVIRMTPGVAMVAARAEDDGPLSFERTLSVSGSVQLAVSTGAGNIRLTRGSGSQVHVHGHITVNHEGSEERAREIAANPPIEQNGDVISVGKHEDREQWRGISIDYDIEAPAGTLLTANSGSGDIVDEGVGQNAKLQTGSGDIHATGLAGPFSVMTGSGNIVAEQTGQGDVVAETGSGNIDLKDIHGGFHGQTGSGDIKASGTPSSSWTLQTGSGTIELWTGNAPVTLDASAGSGEVTTDHEMMVQGSFDHHHIRGNLNGGGPTIRAQTGSGEIHIH